MKRINVLLPIDESELSHQALAVVTHFFNSKSTTITLLTVSASPQLAETSVPPSSIYTGVLDNKLLKADPYDAVQLQELKANIAANLKIKLSGEISFLSSQGFTVTTEVGFGEAAEQIIAEAQSNYDLIIMATHGRTGLRRVLMGSVAEKVLRHVAIPVLLFKPKLEAFEATKDKKKTILIPLDDTDFSATMLKEISNTLEPSVYKLCLLQVASHPKSTDALFLKAVDGWGALVDWIYLIPPKSKETLNKEQLARVAYLEEVLSEKLVKRLRAFKHELNAAGFEVELEVRFGYAAEQIRIFIDEQNIDLVAMATHARGGVEQVLVGSVAKQVLVEGHVPVLMLHPKQELATESLGVKGINPILGAV